MAPSQAVARWKNDLDGKASLPNGDPIPCLLVANKSVTLFCGEEGCRTRLPKLNECVLRCDLAERPIPKEDIQQLCDEHGFIGWIETSAKEDVNVSKAMRYLIEHILYLHEDDDEGSAPAGSTKGANTVSLETAGDPKPKKADCCGGK